MTAPPPDMRGGGVKVALGSLCPRCKIQPLFIDENGAAAVGQVHTISGRGSIATKDGWAALVTMECSNGHLWVEEIADQGCTCSKGATCARCLGLTGGKR